MRRDLQEIKRAKIRITRRLEMVDAYFQEIQTQKDLFITQAVRLLLSSLDEESKQRNQAIIIAYPRTSHLTPRYYGLAWAHLSGHNFGIER